MYYIGLGCHGVVLAGLYKMRPSDPPGWQLLTVTQKFALEQNFRVQASRYFVCTFHKVDKILESKCDFPRCNTIITIIVPICVATCHSASIGPVIFESLALYHIHGIQIFGKVQMLFEHIVLFGVNYY